MHMGKALESVALARCSSFVETSLRRTAMVARASRGLPRAWRPLTRLPPRLQPQGSSLADRVAIEAQRQCQSDMSEQQSGALE